MNKKRKMNLPNKLTLFRIILTPLLVFFLLYDFRFSPLIALVIFAVASVTDFLDGKIARKYGLVTDFGKFLDPIADKIVVLSALICFISEGLCSPVAVIIVIFREFIISSLRLIAASGSVVLAAGLSGKIKTATQMISITAVLAMLSFRSLSGGGFHVETVSLALTWLTAAVALYSGVEYIVVNRQYINPFE